MEEVEEAEEEEQEEKKKKKMKSIFRTDLCSWVAAKSFQITFAHTLAQKEY